MKKFLLIGIGGVYNYGCEAIVRGTEIILRSAWPDAKIIYASYSPEDDRLRLRDCQVDLIHRKLPRRYSVVNISRKLLSFLGIAWRPPADQLSMLKGCDAVLSIGGDIYTLEPNGSFNTSLPKLGNAAERKGIPYILWGASVGPFSSNRIAERFFQEHLSKITLLTIREKKTIDYLKSIGIASNVIACADPAFVVAPDIVRNGSPRTKVVGINLSPLSLNYSGSTPDQVSIAQVEMIEAIIKTFQMRVILIPHVVCPLDENDDDLRYLQRIRGRIDQAYRDSVDLLDNDPGFVGVKRVLVKCDLVIAARMHCAVNAMTAHVPTLLLAYSQKAHGMGNYVYGHDEWVLNLADFTSENAMKIISSMLENQPRIEEFLRRRIPKIQIETRRPISAIKRILDHKV